MLPQSREPIGVNHETRFAQETDHYNITARTINPRQ